jgi:ribosomal protein S18 acetylase RimI-like enzyme
VPTVRAATVDDLPAVGRSLAAAFESDPIWRWLTPPQAHRQERSAGFYAGEAAMQLRGHGEVLVDNDLRGAALWATPGHWKTTFTQTARLAPISVRLFRGRTVRALKLLSQVEARHPSDVPHWYLAYLGTDPAHQGHGIGSSLIASVTERCDEQGLGAYLESSKEENISFYGRHGFEVRERFDVPDGPSMWLMWREPKA